jgi:hypothetical protein
VIEEDFKLPDRTTVMRQVDKFIHEDEVISNGEYKRDFLSNPLDTFSVGFDEWSSKQRKSYMSICLSGISADWSKMADFCLAVAPFKFPHNMKDIREFIIEQLMRFLGCDRQATIRKLHGITYDGTSVNRCFSPDPEAAGITVAEKLDRVAVNREFETVEEATCYEHRLETVLVRVVTDDHNDTSQSYKELLDDLYAVASLVSSSQKNEQELVRVQQEDPVRIGEVVCDIHTPKTRWSYNSRRIIRIL